MPDIQITDELGVNVNAALAPTSSLLKYVHDLPGLILKGSDIGRLQILTLNDPAVRSLQPTLSFRRPVSLGIDGPQLTIGADAGASFRVISRTPDSTTLRHHDMDIGMSKRGDPAARRACTTPAFGSAVHAIHGGRKRERRHFLADARFA